MPSTHVARPATRRSSRVAMLVGLVATVMVQSSSITTSLLVPLAGAGVLTLAQAYWLPGMIPG